MLQNYVEALELPDIAQPGFLANRESKEKYQTDFQKRSMLISSSQKEFLKLEISHNLNHIKTALQEHEIEKDNNLQKIDTLNALLVMLKNNLAELQSRAVEITSSLSKKDITILIDEIQKSNLTKAKNQDIIV